MCACSGSYSLSLPLLLSLPHSPSPSPPLLLSFYLGILDCMIGIAPQNPKGTSNSMWEEIIIPPAPI